MEYADTAQDMVPPPGMLMRNTSRDMTLRENLDAKIRYHIDEAKKLEQLKEKMPQEFLSLTINELAEALSPSLR